MKNRRKFRMACLVAAAFVVAACAGMSDIGDAPVKVTEYGQMTNLRNQTLYFYDKDIVGSGKSNCNGACATTWIPFLVAPQAVPTHDFSFVARDDGSRQWAYKGKPIYVFSGDKEALDTRGDKVDGVWHVLRYPYITGGQQ